MRRVIPEPYIEPPHGVTPVGLLLWITRRQWTTVLQGTICDIVWLLGLALTPWAIGRAIDEGLVAANYGAFLGWLAVVVWLQLQHTLIQGLRDRAGSVNYERGMSRVNQIVSRQSARVTVAADRTLHPGAVVTMLSESWSIPFVPINVGSIASALVAFVTVAVLLLRDSVLLGLLVIVGVPVFSALSFLLVRTLDARGEAAWDARAAMNVVAMDSVKGLRVLRGVGGEGRFLRRFQERSAELRTAGERLAWPRAAAEALNLLIAGTLVAALTWIGGILVSEGQLQIGALVAFFGYAGFLVLPVALINQAMTVGVEARVAARRIVALLAVRPLWQAFSSHDAPDSMPTVWADGPDLPLLFDERSGLGVRAGEMCGVVAADSAEAVRLVNRLSRLAPDNADEVVRFRGQRLDTMSIARVRELIAVADPVPFLFSGTLRSVLDPWAVHDSETILEAVEAVDASDIIDSLGDGIDGTDALDVLVGERGVEFSGGQRQRLGAARALLSRAVALVLHDPTSSVDAPTEERMAAGIRRARAGLTTVVVSTSPLVLAHTDRVVMIDAGVAVAEGQHEQLLETNSAYRAVILRAEGER